ncbi:MAG TPA: hypothetical protein PLJ18_12350 [Niabella sp.]|nr:hypothetical protein [Niabella sp.]
MERIIQTSAKPYKWQGFAFKGKSLTQPDMALTPKTLLENHTRGILSNVTERTPIYNGDIITPDPRSMDLTEIYEFKQANQQQLQQLKDEKSTAKLQPKAGTGSSEPPTPKGNGVEGGNPDSTTPQPPATT